MKIKILLAILAALAVGGSRPGRYRFCHLFCRPDHARRCVSRRRRAAGNAERRQDIDPGALGRQPAPLDRRARYGRYLLQVFAAADNTLIYRKGFDSYFGEYKTTEPAAQGVAKTLCRIVPHPLSQRADPARSDAARPAEPAAADLQDGDRSRRHVHRPRKAWRRRRGDRAGEERARRRPRSTWLFWPRATRRPSGRNSSPTWRVSAPSSSARSPIKPTRTASTSPACSRLRSKAAATSRATECSRTPSWAPRSIRSARSATC